MSSIGGRQSQVKELRLLARYFIFVTPRNAKRPSPTSIAIPKSASVRQFLLRSLALISSSPHLHLLEFSVPPKKVLSRERQLSSTQLLFI